MQGRYLLPTTYIRVCTRTPYSICMYLYYLYVRTFIRILNLNPRSMSTTSPANVDHETLCARSICVNVAAFCSKDTDRTHSNEINARVLSYLKIRNPYFVNNYQRSFYSLQSISKLMLMCQRQNLHFVCSCIDSRCKHLPLRSLPIVSFQSFFSNLSNERMRQPLNNYYRLMINCDYVSTCYDTYMQYVHIGTQYDYEYICRYELRTAVIVYRYDRTSRQQVGTYQVVLPTSFCNFVSL